MSEMVAGVLIASGAFAVLVGAVALMRLPDVYTRVSGSGVGVAFGLIAMLGGLMAAEPRASVILPAALLGVFLLVTVPLSSHIIARTARLRGEKPCSGTREPERSPEDPGQLGR